MGHLYIDMYSALEKEFGHNEKIAAMSLLSACHHQTIRSAFVHLPGQHPIPNTQHPTSRIDCQPPPFGCDILVEEHKLVGNVKDDTIPLVLLPPPLEGPLLHRSPI